MKRLSVLMCVMAMCSTAMAQQAPKAPDKVPAKITDKVKDATDKAKDGAKDAMDKMKDGAKAPADAMKAMEDAWAKAAEPGANHKMLETFVGHWDAKATEFNPDGSSKEMAGKLESQLIMGGRYLQMDYKGRNAKGQFMNGMGLMGYCNGSKQFEHLWIDSMGTHMDTQVGQADASGKVISLKGEMPNPMGGSMKTRQVLTVKSKDAYTLEYFGDVGGTEMKWMEIAFTRTADAKGEKPTDKPADKPAAPAKGK